MVLEDSQTPVEGKARCHDSEEQYRGEVAGRSGVGVSERDVKADCGYYKSYHEVIDAVTDEHRDVDLLREFVMYLGYAFFRGVVVADVRRLLDVVLESVREEKWHERKEVDQEGESPPYLGQIAGGDHRHHKHAVEHCRCVTVLFGALLSAEKIGDEGCGEWRYDSGRYADKETEYDQRDHVRGEEEERSPYSVEQTGPVQQFHVVELCTDPSSGEHEWNRRDIRP